MSQNKPQNVKELKQVTNTNEVEYKVVSPFRAIYKGVDQVVELNSMVKESDFGKMFNQFRLNKSLLTLEEIKQLKERK